MVPILLSINKISKSFGTRVIFNEADFDVGKKEKIGVIGRNGAGKTTLLKMILGETGVDEGEIIIPDGTRVGYLEQQSKFSGSETVMEFLRRDSRREEWECAKAAGNFRLKNELLQARIKGLSGGYQMRVRLAAMLLRDPNLLLLDEPTNHLDLSTLLLLEDFLRTFNGSHLIISHDKTFLKNTCDKTLEVDQGKLYTFPGSVDQYLAHKEQQKKSAEKYNKKIRKEQKHLQAFVDRFRYKASKATQAQSKIKQIKRLSEVKIRESLSTARIIIPPIEKRKGLAIRVNDLAIGYPDKTIATKITLDIHRGDHIAVLGDNGQGKSTFFKTLNNELAKISGGFRWMPNTRVASYSQHVTAELDPKDQVGSYLEKQAGANVNQEDVLRIAGNFLFYGDDVKKSISILSGGEKARLCLAGLLLQECNVLLLDEPTNHLDFDTVEMLGQALSQSEATILFISHNREFIETVARNIIEVDAGRIKMTGHNYTSYLSHLRGKAGLDDEPGTGRKSIDEADKKAAAKEKRIMLKEKKKELQKEASKLKKEIEYNKAVEQKLIQEYNADNYKYSRQRDEQVKRLKTAIFDDEMRMLEIEESIEEINS